MRVLLATDGSDSAQIALDVVAGLRWPIGSSVRVVRALDTGAELFGGPWPAAAVIQSHEVEARLVIEAEADLEDVSARLRGLGLQVDHAILRGRPGDQIVADIRSHRPDLVIVGYRGHSTFERMLLGSVSAEVVDHSPVPVLVARKATLDRVVVAVDGSDVASEAVDAVRSWPFLSGADIRVLSVAPNPVDWWASLAPGIGEDLARDFENARALSLADHRRFATEAADRLRSAGLDARPEARAGLPADGIVAFATEWDADLLILGSHGRTGLARLILGSVARNVLHHASCSVLIIKRHAEPRLLGEPALGVPAWSMSVSH